MTERADRLVFVKEGFSWPAFFVPLLWLIYHRMWLELVLLLLVYVALQLGVRHRRARADAVGWAGFAIVVLFAFEANDLRRPRSSGAATGSSAWPAAATASTPSARSSALAAATGEGPRANPPPAPAPRRDTGARARLPRGEGEEVIGLFPRP